MSRWSSHVVVVLVTSLIAGACTRSETAAPGTSTSAPVATAPSGDGLENGGFGTLRSVCGDGDAKPVDGVSGVEDTTIRVGTFSDIGFAGRPGLNKELFDTATAVVKWCNDHGGVRGYRIETDLLDAALTNYQPKMVEACGRDFFLVGGGAVFDDTGQEERLKCGLPDMSAFSVNEKAAGADLVLTSLPNPEGQLAAPDFVYAQRRWPEAVSKVAIITVAVPATLTVRDRYLEAFERLGWETVYQAELLPLGEASYLPYVEAMKSKGVELVVLITEAENLATIQRTAADAGFEPTAWLPSTNVYDRTYIATAGDVAVDTYTRSVLWPIEEASENQATADYLSLLDDVNGKVALLGMQGVSMWMLFLTSLGTCIDAGTVTRDCVYREASQARTWTAGGLHAPTDVTRESAPECYLMLEATPDGWVRAPQQTLDDDGYDCSPEYVVPLSGDYGEGARCPGGVEDPLPSECA